jgi:uncharacterized repeat protein (TIGR01451 family)
MSRVSYATISLILVGTLIAAFVRAQDTARSSNAPSATFRSADTSKSVDSNLLLLQRYRSASRTAATEYLAEGPATPSAPRLLTPPQATTPLRPGTSGNPPATLVSHESGGESGLRSVLVRTAERPANSPSAPSDPAATSQVQQAAPPAPAAMQASPSDAAGAVELPSETRSTPATPVDPAPAPTHRVSVDESGTTSGISSRRPKRVQVPSAYPSQIAARPVDGPAAEEVADAPPRTLATGTIPSLRIDTVGPASVTLGSEVSYRVLVTNQSDVAADGVAATISVPAGVQLLAADSSAGQTTVDNSSAGAARVVFSIPRLAGRDSVSVTLQLKPTTNEAFALAAEWSLQAPSLAAEIEVKQPLLELEVTGPADLDYGEKHVYSIILSNPGTGDAKNVSIRVAMGSDTSDTLVIGTIPAGSSKTYDVEIIAREVGNMQVAAAAAGDGDLQAQAAQSIAVHRGQIRLDAQGPGLQYAGTTGTYAVRVANVGDATAKTVQASVQLPAGVKYSRGIDNARQEGDRLVWTVGDLAAGTEKVYQFQCELSTDGDQLLRFAADSGDGLSGNQDVMTRVEAIADLTLAVNDPKGPLPVGKDVKYEIQVTNRGTKAATQVRVIGQFSEGIEPILAEGMRAEVVDGQVVFDPIAQIEPGATIDLTVSARAETAGNHVFRAAVQCEDPETRLIAEDTTRFYGSEISGGSADPTAVTPGIESARSPAPAPTFGSGNWR